MRYNSFRTPGLSAADGGLFEDDLVLKPPPYQPGESDGEEEALRLAPARAAPLPDPPAAPRFRKGVPLPLLMAGWAAVLGAALGVAYIVQPVRQLDGQADLPAAPPPPTDAALGTPVTAPSIASQPAQFASAAPAN